MASRRSSPRVSSGRPARPGPRRRRRSRTTGKRNRPPRVLKRSTAPHDQQRENPDQARTRNPVRVNLAGPVGPGGHECGEQAQARRRTCSPTVAAEVSPEPLLSPAPRWSLAGASPKTMPGIRCVRSAGGSRGSPRRAWSCPCLHLCWLCPGMSPACVLLLASSRFANTQQQMLSGPDQACSSVKLGAIAGHPARPPESPDQWSRPPAAASSLAATSRENAWRSPWNGLRTLQQTEQNHRTGRSLEAG